MNIGSLGMASSIAATSLQQTKSSDSERVAQQSDAQKASEKLSAKSSTDSEINENESATDRDADGRMLWEVKEAQGEASQGEEASEGDSKKSIDVSGDRGGKLDLSG